jgi:hypothetical protein
MSYLEAQPQGPLEELRGVIALAVEGHDDDRQRRRAVHLLKQAHNCYAQSCQYHWANGAPAARKRGLAWSQVIRLVKPSGKIAREMAEVAPGMTVSAVTKRVAQYVRHQPACTEVTWMLRWEATCRYSQELIPHCSKLVALQDVLQKGVEALSLSAHTVSVTAICSKGSVMRV